MGSWVTRRAHVAGGEGQQHPPGLVCAVIGIRFKPQPHLTALFAHVNLERARRERVGIGFHRHILGVAFAGHHHGHVAGLHKVRLNALDAGPQVVSGLLLGAHQPAQRADAVGLKVALHGVHVGQVDLVVARLVLPQGVRPSAVDLVARPHGLWKHLREYPRRPTSAQRLASVVPARLAGVVDDGVGAFGRIALGVKPPDLAVAWHLGGPYFLAGVVVQVVKEVILAILVRYLLHHAVVAEEPVHATPVIDAVVLNHAAGRHDGGLAAHQVVGPVVVHAARAGGLEAHADQRISRPEQAARRR